MIQTFSEMLRKQIRAEMNEVADHLAGGGARTMEDYRRLTGKIEGLAFAETQLIALTENALGEGETE